MEQRVKYCEFWRRKLDGNDDVVFPLDLVRAIAGITKGFSFAYIQEAFVAALLAIANGDASVAEEVEEGRPLVKGFGYERCVCKKTDFEMAVRSRVQDGEQLDKFVLWREIKKVVKTLREELEVEKGADAFACGVDCERIGT